MSKWRLDVPLECRAPLEQTLDLSLGLHHCLECQAFGTVNGRSVTSSLCSATQRVTNRSQSFATRPQKLLCV